VYEPWHIRYVGIDIAEDVAKQGMTLEEYFDENNIKL
jgi:D-alanyl-D-alanine carboxypeptidase